MSDTDGLSAPGGSIYSSSTMYVGDGTWDSDRNSFLLPNLMGLNFDTMQYNGMGNRFRDLPQYQSLILGHGVMAAIVFIVIVPAAIFTAKYGHWDRQNSYKLHVYLQVLTVFLTTVVLILGWFAVGPERSLTNPHHGIGVAIYVLVLFQFIYGWLMSNRERKRKVIPTKIPLRVWLHKLLGRSIALLGFAQVALGLTLYGSPKALFVLYAIAGFILIFAYLALDYYYKDRIDGPPPPRPGNAGTDYYSDYDSYVSGTHATQDPRRRNENRSHWGRNLLAGAGALGVYEAYKHRRDRRRQEREDGRVNTVGRYDTPGRQRPPPPGNSIITPVTPSRPPPGRRPDDMPPHTPYGSHRPYDQHRLSPQSWENDEKYSPPPKNTWRNRILGAGAGIAAVEGARRLFGRRRKTEDDQYAEDYRPPHGGNHNAISQADVSRVDAGHAPYSPDDSRRRHDLPEGASTMTPTHPPRDHRPNDTHGTDAEYDEESFFDDRPHTLRDSIAVFGALGGFQNWMSQRKHRREQSRVNRLSAQDEANADRYNRRTSMNYPRPSDGRRPSMSETVMTGTTQDPAQRPSTDARPDVHHPPLPFAAGAIPATAVAGGALGAIRHDHADSRHDVVDSRHNLQQSQHNPQDSRHNLQNSRQDITAQNTYVLPPPPPGPAPGALARPPPVPGSAHMPAGAVDPDPSRLLASNTAANEASAYGRTHTAEAGAAGLAAGMLAGRAGRTQSESPSRLQSRERLQRPSEVVASSSGATDIHPPPGTANSPPISLKLKMHNDSGGHVTLRRLNEEEAAAERAARRRDRRQRPRRDSSLSSGIEEGPPSQRYRRQGGMVPSASQPIGFVPPPPPMSSAAGSARRDSELNLPPLQGSSPPVNRPYPPPSGSGMINPVGSPGPYTTDAGTDVSAFDENRRRRRAERARQQRQAGQVNRVEFE
ncbi:hypothetical protein AMS68_002462 [Peltaster fructicola]|uniref:Cytochrome b561 domain-containing protein n=1 Tax=Peltaster fructicola TaxID=286661 RepID=A0A6H0XQN5_9PEZI|nr:hypothetical protein AMS68_002462 [Peltaster fructicola]